MDDGERYLYYRGIALKMVRAYLAKYHLCQDAHSMAHDIASDIIMRELSGEWSVKINVSRVIGFKIMEAVHGPYKKRRDKTIVPLSPEVLQIPDRVPVEKIAASDPLDMILESENGRLLALCLWKRRRGRLRDVVLRVAEIAGEKWTRENIAAIVQVKKTLSRRK